MKFLYSVIISVLLLIASCRNQPEEKDSFKPSFSTFSTDSTGKVIPAQKKEIYYGLLTPVEVCEMFNRLGVPFNSAVINPVSKSDLYMSSSKAALNTGIYGVDFGYVKMFGIGQEMVGYMITIREMCNKLGIPDSYITEPIKKIQGEVSDPDSIMTLMNTAFTRMEDHLRESGRESTAGLLVAGGWTEAMFIATHLLYDPEKPDAQVIARIAEQKYTLNTLLSHMKNYYDDPVVVYYSKKLKYLKNYFDSFDIVFKKGDLEIDKSRKVFRASGTDMDITVETLNKIRDYVERLRTEMVTP